MTQLTVYYDEMCVLCAKEIHHYQKQTGSDKISFVDITAPNFDAAKENVDPFLVHKIMHSKTNDGILHTKINAFIEIWKILPKYHWLAKVVGLPGIRQIASAAYDHVLAPVIYHWHLRRLGKQTARVQGRQ